MLSVNSKEQLKTVLLASICSCLYIPLIIILLSLRGTLYNVGKWSSSYVLVILFVAESLKLSLLSYLKTGSTRLRKSKVSGIYVKIKELLFVTASVIVFFIGIILFGAPALSDHEETMMLAVLLAVITIYPLTKYVGIETTLQIVSGVKGSSSELEVEMLRYNLIWTVCATWLGAVAIPLDWNRPWQVWPIPCYLGALAGYFSANVITAANCFYTKKINLQYCN